MVSCIALCLILMAPLQATDDQAREAAPAPAGPTDFDFLEGRWSIVYNNAQPGIPPNVAGTWTALKQADGRVLYDEFRLFGPDKETVALGATYRVFDHVRKKWDMRYVGLLLKGRDGVVRLPAQWAELSAWREGERHPGRPARRRVFSPDHLLRHLEGPFQMEGRCVHRRGEDLAQRPDPH